MTSAESGVDAPLSVVFGAPGVRGEPPLKTILTFQTLSVGIILD
jgi:hypothetical protein